MKKLSQLMDLTGRNVLLTGGAGHIGLAASEALMELGATVALTDQNEDSCRKRVDELSKYGKGKALAFPTDLSDEHATRAMVKNVVKELKGLDILIHCAAYVCSSDMSGWSVPFKQQTVKQWDAALRVNLTSAFVMVQEAQEALARSGRGSVILFSSIYGMGGPDESLYEGTSMINPVGYGVSKGGVLQLTRYLATGLAPNIRVNAISPGGVWRNQPESFHQKYKQRTPMQRMAVEEDLKGAVAYLASDLSAYVTGHNLVVDGGWTAW